MKKFFAIILATVTLALCLTGCVYEDLNVKLNKDGTGSIAATVGLKKDFVDQMMDGQNPFEGKETQEIEVDGDKYIAYTETKEYASFEEIEKALADMTYETGDFGDMSEPVENELEDVSTEPADSEDSAGDFFLTDPVDETPAVSKDDHIFKSVEITKDGSRYVFDAVLNKVEGQIQGYDMSDVFKVSISVEMPAKISAYKNGTVDGKKITFDLSDMSEELELYAECKTASVVPVIICGVLVVASIVAFIVIRKRK